MALDRDIFAWRGGAVGATAAILAVPHAGRDYPAPLLAAARVAATALRGLEDRYADLLVDAAGDAGHAVLVARVARAWVDLNRAPDEHDGAGGAQPVSARVRRGLGVFPSALPEIGGLWRGAFDADDLAMRLAKGHAPYHAALAAALATARARHGSAVLLDVHSMPRHAGKGWPRSADIVLGDRHGTSADRAIVSAIARTARAAGLHCARNVPYAGGHGTTLHGRPDAAIHAVQVEIARDLYLTPTEDPDGAGVARISGFVRAAADAAAAAVIDRRDAARAAAE